MTENETLTPQQQDWRRRQLINAPRGRYLEPTIGQRMRRMSAYERDEVRRLLRSLTLRNAIRQTLYAHFHGLHKLPRDTSLQRLRYHAQEQQSNENVRAQFNEQRTPFELHVTRSEQARLVVPK